MVSCVKDPHQSIYYDNSMKNQEQEHVYQQEDSRENLDTYLQNHCFWFLLIRSDGTGCTMCTQQHFFEIWHT